ncbi:MAG: hypothetical protein GX567_17335 [Clostridia bacterium]|jgi:hypothetical protein|nr:hypothetical protein [Clostridia bacterium]
MEQTFSDLEVMQTMRMKLMEADKESLPVMDDLNVSPKERRNDKLRKITNHSEGSSIWNICDTVVMLNFVGDTSTNDIMDEYIQSYTRVSY